MVAEIHPSSYGLKAYSQGLSSNADLEKVEQHLLFFERCEDELAQTDWNVAMKEVPASESGKRLRSIHLTEDGPIFGSLHTEADGKWEGRHWGRQLDGYRACDSVEEAYRYLTESFSQMFPEHRCSTQCKIWKTNVV